MYGPWELKVISLLHTLLTFSVLLIHMHTHAHTKLLVYSMSHLISCDRSQTKCDLPHQLKTVYEYCRCGMSLSLRGSIVRGSDSSRPVQLKPFAVLSNSEHTRDNCGGCLCVWVHFKTLNRMSTLDKSNWCNKSCCTYILLRPALQEGGKKRGPGR